MIRYNISLNELENLVSAQSTTWLQRALDRTTKFRQLGKFSESSSIWSEVKPVFMKIQHSKCAFCERQLTDVAIGAVEQDLEHFRPKGRIRQWNPPDGLQDVPFTSISNNNNSGYHLLPYNLLNYSASCKPCNSTLKSDCFPIAGQHNTNTDNYTSLQLELPYLIFPVGDNDVDPETLITFHGIVPMATANIARPDQNRARVTIAFFSLNDSDSRKDLILARVRIIIALHYLFLTIENQGIATDADTNVLAYYISDRAPHTNCARSFNRTYLNDRNEASEIFNLCREYLSTTSHGH